MNTKTNNYNLTVLTSTLIISVFVMCFLVIKANPQYTILLEDINNSCTTTDNKRISSTVAVRIVEIQVPSNKADSYLEKAAKENRCVFRKPVENK